MKKIMSAVFVLVITSTVIMAQTPGINQTQREQQKRIAQGVKSGQLTPNEAKKLEMEQRNIQHQKQIAKADGVVTHHEKKMIKKKQIKASKDIYRAKHNKRHHI